jgi:CheY-like chemotaxis protein
VLVVEPDSAAAIRIAEELSGCFDCMVDIVAHGVEALEMAAVERYALVIAAAEMPVMGGQELSLWLREAQPLTASPFVLLADGPCEEQVVASRVNILPRSVRLARLIEVCERFFERARHT